MKKIIYITIIGILLFGIVGNGNIAFAYTSGEMPDETVAMVGDYPVTLADFSTELELLKARTSQSTPIDPKLLSDLKQQALKNAIHNVALKNCVEKYNAGMSDEDATLLEKSVYADLAKGYGIEDVNDYDLINQTFSEANPNYSLDNLITRKIDETNVQRLKALQSKNINDVFQKIYMIAEKTFETEAAPKDESLIVSIKKMMKEQKKLSSEVSSVDPKKPTSQMSLFNLNKAQLLKLRISYVQQKLDKDPINTNPFYKNFSVALFTYFFSRIEGSMSDQTRYWYDSIGLDITGLNTEEKAQLMSIGAQMLEYSKKGMSFDNIRNNYFTLINNKQKAGGIISKVDQALIISLQTKCGAKVLTEKEKNAQLKDKTTSSPHLLKDLVTYDNVIYLLKFMQTIPIGAVIPVDCAVRLDAYCNAFKEEMFTEFTENFITSWLADKVIVQNDKYFA